MHELKFIDLFCGVGGFHVAADIVCNERGVKPVCVFSSDIDPDAQRVYETNFGRKPHGDITKINERDISGHDILFGGFPCQAFSIIGERKGFEDTRGTLFFDIARILNEKRPSAFVLENVKQLETHNRGETLRRIMETLREIGYHADHKILNALNFGLPQKRERIFIIGFREPRRFLWPVENISLKPLSEVLEKNVSEFYYASKKIRKNRIKSRENKRVYNEPTIWHENKGGNISALPFSCALRAGASYNYLLVNGERRLTEREMFRLQGFPESYKIDCGYSAARKLAGNSVPVPCVAAVLRSVMDALGGQVIRQTRSIQQNFLFEVTAS